MKVKYILLKLDEKTHRKLWNEKEAKAIFLGKEVTWEEFLIERR